jgi:hypothetical protein
MTVSTAPKTVVCVDTRRAVFMAAKGRRKDDVQKVKHEDFIRQMLKDRMGWPKRDPAPDSIKTAAREMAAILVQQEKDAAAAQKAKLDAAKASQTVGG